MCIDFRLQFIAIVAAALGVLNGPKESATPFEDARRQLAQANQSLNEEESKFKESERKLAQATAAAADWERRVEKAGAGLEKRIQAVSQGYDAIAALRRRHRT